MKKKYVVTEKTAQEIREIIKQYEKTSVFRKLQAIMLLGEGKGVPEVSRITLYHPKRVYELIKQYCTSGIDEFLKDARGGANRRNLSDEQEKQIIEKFDEKARAGQVVSLHALKAEYERVRGCATANSTFYSFLKRMNWRRVMPRGAHPKKASDEVIEASKKLTV